jgi:hypothetical protein
MISVILKYQLINNGISKDAYKIKQQQPRGQMHFSETDINIGPATRHLLKYRCNADHVRFVYGSFDISFILKFKKVGTVHMTLMVARSRNHCCGGKAAISSKCIVEMRVTAIEGKI